MKTKYISWEKYEKVESFGSGTSEWNIVGEDEDGKQYSAVGTYLDGELVEVTDIEEE